jgi:sugar lactone lactonase YvrE
LARDRIYDAATDTAWWFDIVERRLFEARLGTGQTTIHSLDVMGSALGRIDAHRQLLVAMMASMSAIRRMGG